MLKPALALILSMLVLPSFAEASCPVINGKYVMRVNVDGVERDLGYALTPRQEESGVVSYLASKDPLTYVPADGVDRPVEVQTVVSKFKFYCQGKSLVREVSPMEGPGVLWTKFTLLTPNKLKVDTNAPGRSGIYLKQ